MLAEVAKQAAAGNTAAKKSLRELSEHYFRKAVTAYAESHGWIWYGVDRTATRQVDGSYRGLGPSGFPDLVLVRGKVLYAELKAERGSTSADQKMWLARLSKAGAKTAIWKPRDAAAIIAALGGKNGT